MRILGVDYGDSRVGLSITDELMITAQGLETIYYKGDEEVLFKRLDEIMNKYLISTIVVGVPVNMNGTKTTRADITERFICKLESKYDKIKIERVDERLTTVEAHKTMNLLNVNKYKKKNIVDTISAVYILETYMNKNC